MSQLSTQTCCPHCQTAFRVTPDQLSARDGRVRCGKCHQVFNALDYLLDEEPDVASYFPPIQADLAPDGVPLTALKPPFAEPQQSVAFVEPVFAEPPPVAKAHVPVAPPFAEPQLTDFDEPDTAYPPDPIIDPVIDMVEMIDVSAMSNVEPLSPPPSRPAIDPIDAALAEQEDTASRAEISRLSPEEVKERGREAGLVAPRGLREIPGYSLWSDGTTGGATRTYALWPFVVASVALALLLAGQLLHHYRGALATGNPGAQTAYAAFGIEIPLPRDPDFISIDASELQAVTTENDPEAYTGHLQLVATLKNQANHPQGWPHLEIALTDAYDAILTRKVFKPGEYLPADAPPAFAAGETLVTLDLAVGELKPNGYRLNLLYP